MAISLNANVGTLTVTTATNSFVVPTPSGSSAGDVLFCVLNLNSRTASVTTPAGWTLDQTVNSSLSANSARTYWRVADGTEGSSVTFAISANQLGSGTMLAISGADTIAPSNARSTTSNNTSSANQNAPSVTPSITGGLLICTASGVGSGSYTPPSGMTEQSDLANSATTTTVATQTGMTTSATGTKTFTASVSGTSVTTSTVIVPPPSVTLSVPAGTASGDLLFAQIYANSSGATLPAATLPAGWTQIDSLALDPGVQNVRLTSAYRIAGASEPASYDFAANGATNTSNLGGLMRRYAGPWAASPLDAHSAQQNGSSASASAAGVTVTQAGSLALMSVAQSSTKTITPPSGFAAGANATLAGPGYRHDILENTAIASGATGTLTATLSGAVFNEAFLAVFRPGTSGTTVSAPVLAGSGALLAPLPKLALAAPVLAGTGALPVPTPTLRLLGVVLTGSGLLPAPTLGLISNPTVLAPVLAGSGLLPAPTVSAGILIAAPVLTGAGVVLAPLPTLTLSAPVLAGSGLLPAGTPVLILAAPLLTGAGVLLGPSLSLSSSVSAPLLSGSGQLLAGTPGLSLGAPVLAGNGSILDGSIALSQVIQAGVLRGSGLLPVPQLVILTPLPGWGIMAAAEPFAVVTDASLHGAAIREGMPVGVIVALDPSGQINRGEPFALIVDASPTGKG